MALSMFLRTPGCLHPVLRQSLARFTTKSSAMQSNLPASSMLRNNATTLSKPVNSTPILDSVRSLRTSSVRQTFAKDEHAHDHAKLWVIERSVTALMVPLVPAALMFPNKFLDVALAILITAHSHWGLEAIAVDYVRAAIFGPVIPKVAIALVYLISIATLGGLFYLISHDVGFGQAVRDIWAVKADKKA
ncbi:hypothetical protein O0L34_g4011 [Tuta absoluta]|nr:hypothetical protein O0L34_g4011 [Tuta absoluta]